MWNCPAASWPFCCRQLKTVWPCSYCHGSASTAVISCNVMTMQMGCWLTPTAVLHLHTCVRQQVWKIRMRVKLLVVSSCQDTIANLTHLINQTCIPSCCRSTVWRSLGKCVGTVMISHKAAYTLPRPLSTIKKPIVELHRYAVHGMCAMR